MRCALALRGPHERSLRACVDSFGFAVQFEALWKIVSWGKTFISMVWSVSCFGVLLTQAAGNNTLAVLGDCHHIHVHL